MRVRIDYGKGILEVELPARNVAGVLRVREVEPLADVEAELRGTLADPVGCATLARMARGRRDACVVIPDKTRPLPNALVLPAILETIECAGIARDDILILVATGLHRANEGKELVELVGDRIAREYRCESHVARDADSHARLAVTSRGVAIEVDRRYVEADLKVLLGLVEPHFMAGFSGGRKMVCPGITSSETIRRFHGPALLAEKTASAGVLRGNPVHETALEVARTAGVDFTVNVVIDAKRRLVGIFAGELEAAHEAAAALSGEVATAYVDCKVPIVVTGCGGYPLDDTFYQAVKGIVAADPILEDGGTVIAAARISEGIGSEEYTRLMLDTDDWREFDRRLMERHDFVIDQWELQMQIRVLRRGRIMMASDGLDPETLRSCFVTPVVSVEDGIARALAEHGEDAKIAVIPQGPYVIAEVK